MNEDSKELISLCQKQKVGFLLSDCMIAQSCLSSDLWQMLFLMLSSAHMGK